MKLQHSIQKLHNFEKRLSLLNFITMLNNESLVPIINHVNVLHSKCFKLSVKIQRKVK